jgi:hypothetical protein
MAWRYETKEELEGRWKIKGRNEDVERKAKETILQSNTDIHSYKIGLGGKENRLEHLGDACWEKDKRNIQIKGVEKWSSELEERKRSAEQQSNL